jgi:hypothetical protein
MDKIASIFRLPPTISLILNIIHLLGPGSKGGMCPLSYI